MKCILDTNVWIDGVAGRLAYKKFKKVSLEPSWTGYSAITRLELLGFPGITEGGEKKLLKLLNNFTEVSVSTEIIDDAILLRKANRIKVPDALIAAAARVTDSVLVTRNISDFRKIKQIELLNPHEL